MLESKRRATIFLLLAFLLASVAGYLVYQKVKDLNSELGGMTKIYVAKSDIPARTLIQENQVTTMEIPNKFYVKDSHVVKKDELVNTVLVVPVSKGHIITENMLKPFSNLRNENNRLVSMYPSEKVQFDQVIEALDRVDIIVSTDDNGKQKTEIFMRDVPVAYADGEGKNFSGVALEVSMEDAPKLIHIQNYADKVRVLKANVGKGDTMNTAAPAETDTTKEGAEQKTQPTGTHQPKAQQPATTTPKKTDTTKSTDTKPADTKQTDTKQSGTP
ncbi:SAF domain-containing protein [Bacillus sp. JJ1609]|uniref:SAF domain-containing protein n=1 Tax=Bacillus sp. JJ1609 TaxID=3122977 RepID=UPI002FFD7BE4